MSTQKRNYLGEALTHTHVQDQADVLRPPRSRVRCGEFARKGTGYGPCDRPVDLVTGLCDRPDQHTTQEEINPEPRHRWVGSRPTLEQY